MNNNLKSFRLLIVEDQPMMQKLIYDVLVSLGFTAIFKVSSGQAALQIMEQESIDFVICDWRMGAMDGIEFTKVVRGSLSSYALVPIIMLTGNAEKEHVLQARDAGVNEYLIKPFTVKDLCSRLKEIIENPREFVLAPVYKGPSRRRRSLVNVMMPERRQRGLSPQLRSVHVRSKSR